MATFIWLLLQDKLFLDADAACVQVKQIACWWHKINHCIFTKNVSIYGQVTMNSYSNFNRNSVDHFGYDLLFGPGSEQKHLKALLL